MQPNPPAVHAAAQFSIPGICPCGSGAPSKSCCIPVIENRSAATAEALMRSRYTAFVAGFPDYLLATWHPDTRPATLELSGEQKWLGLRIRQCIQGGANDFSGIVEFVARYKINGKGYRLHEISRFSKEAGQWFYLDGELKS